MAMTSPGADASRDEATGAGFNEAAILRKRKATPVGGVDQSCLAAKLLATLQNYVVDKTALGISVKFGAKHPW